jgi:hypothetical protein
MNAKQKFAAQPIGVKQQILNKLHLFKILRYPNLTLLFASSSKKESDLGNNDFQ